NGHDPGLLRQHPGKGDLGASDLLTRGDLTDAIHEGLIRLESSGCEARERIAEVVAVELRVRADGAGEEASPKRAVGNEPDPELPERRENSALGLPPPKRIFALQSGDRLNRMGAADSLGAGFGQAEIPDLALLDEISHVTGDHFDRYGGIDPVLVEEVDVV